MKLEVWGATDGRCPQCNNLKIILEKRGIDFTFVDVDADDIGRALKGISNIPVTILYDDLNNEVKRVVGFGEATRNKINELLSDLNA